MSGIGYNRWSLNGVNVFLNHVARITELQKLLLKEGFLYKIFLEDSLLYRHKLYSFKGIGKVIPLQARCGPEGGYRYSATIP